MTEPATVPPPPSVAYRPNLPPVRGTVARALRLIRDQPRASLTPFAVVQIPLAAIVGILTIVLYLTVFGDEPPETSAGVLTDAGSGPVFTFLVMTAVEVVFGQVAQGAAIISMQSAVAGHRVPLTAALDPAFTRMGALILLPLIIAAIALPLAFTVVALPIAVYFLLRTALSFQALMIEKLGPVAAVRRSWQLTQGNVLRLLGVLFLAGAVLAVPFLLVSALGSLVAGGRTTQVLLTGLWIIVQGALAIPFAGFMTATTTLYYLTIRAARDERTAV